MRKNTPYAHFAEICGKFGNKQNIRKSHIRVFLTYLTYRDSLI